MRIYPINIEYTNKQLYLLKKEMLAEAQNGMKKIARDWNIIFPEYKFYRENCREMPPHECLYCALLTSDTNHLNLEDLVL